ncbi:hypothetical protein F8M41_023289 [Gigaspora margarita]|uniref:Uncharacterized protein n=1 Tax=Gigaspora margarita TaxID=4874 RepID=A0A8H4ETD6_GIGMA|nr:hypothetical protein F8M41_023289 [Gigaspora margarita]
MAHEHIQQHQHYPNQQVDFLSATKLIRVWDMKQLSGIGTLQERYQMNERFCGQNDKDAIKWDLFQDECIKCLRSFILITEGMDDNNDGTI